ncbi:hypothetical protein L195_g063790, partial [Trifolium pratense]
VVVDGDDERFDAVQEYFLSIKTMQNYADAFLPEFSPATM